MALSIKVENLYKAYQLGQFGTGTLSLDLERWWASVRGKEDPFLRIGETNDRSKKGENNVVWSLNDVNLEIEQGSAVGIIGKNGAGKSTFLKILSQVTTPTSGTVKMKGRVASLLEVGTGFHPELTGRENIYLNGAILGMRKAEIARKFDEIVDFSGVERYIDTPVKRYSSGMYVRLAFAVAAHLESEILIVDEVLAVGDAEFQQKCLGKLGNISSGEGRTVLFVSHNMDSIQQLCQSCILLENGAVEGSGGADEIIGKYYAGNQFYQRKETSSFTKGATIEKIYFIDSDGYKKNIFSYQEEIALIIEYNIQVPMKNSIIWFDVRRNGQILFCSSDMDTNNDFNLFREVGSYKKVVKFAKCFFNGGGYSFVFGINSYKPDLDYDRAENISLSIYDDTIRLNPEFNQRLGLMKPQIGRAHV
jgi:lipopolysaccharide transport system ATP-binding protein